MVTQFGKILRKLRVDNNEYIKDMAVKLNVTISYVSAVELGKREIPIEWLDVIRETYALSKSAFIELQEAAYEGKHEITLKFNEEDKQLALALVREFNDLTSTQKDILKDMFLS